MSPLDMFFMFIVCFSVFKIIQLWVVWELKGEK